jgi:hypothetical protein
MVQVDRQSSYQRTIIVFGGQESTNIGESVEEGSKAHFNTVSFVDDLPGVWSGTGNREHFIP